MEHFHTLIEQHFMFKCIFQNKYSLAAETTIRIQLQDVNDLIPVFTEGILGYVLENEPPGTPVMKVQAIDLDSTAANNKVGLVVLFLLITTVIILPGSHTPPNSIFRVNVLLHGFL